MINALANEVDIDEANENNYRQTIDASSIEISELLKLKVFTYGFLCFITLH